jgi:hypothetical protein
MGQLGRFLRTKAFIDIVCRELTILMRIGVFTTPFHDVDYIMMLYQNGPGIALRE